MFLKKEVPVDWNLRCETPAAKGDPTGERRGRNALGKQVPGVEIITHAPFRKTAPFPPIVCQSFTACISGVKASVWRQRSHFTMGFVFRVTNALFIHIIFTDMHFLFNFIHPVFSPFIHHFNDRQQGHSKFSHRIFDFWRDLGIHLPMDDAVFH